MDVTHEFRTMEDKAMKQINSFRHIVFFGFALLFSLLLLSDSPLMAQAGVTTTPAPTPTLTPTPTETPTETTDIPAEKDTSKDSDEKKAPVIKLNVRSKSLVKGKTYKLNVYNLTEEQKVSFKSDTPEIVSVDEEGLITGEDFGSAVITVTVKEKTKLITTLTCEITVGPPAISVKLTKNELMLMVGKRTNIRAILQPYNTVEEIKYLSSDTTVATISTGGRITAKSTGTAVIYAMLDNGKFDCCTLTVVDKETYQKLMEESQEPSDLESQEPIPSGDDLQAEPTPTTEAPTPKGE